MSARDNDTGLTLDNAFWRFSLAVYGAPGVAEECLGVQEEFGVDVNVLLYCAWLAGARATTLTPDDLAGIAESVQTWHEGAVKPLRRARKFMKTQGGQDIADLRTRLKRIEIEAEQIEQAMLFAHAQARWPVVEGATPASALRSNLTQLLRTCGWRAPPGGATPLPRLTSAALTLAAGQRL